MEIKKANLKFKNKLTPRKKTEEIVLHCSATPEGKDFKPADIHRWHLERNWAGAGYHFLITRDGTIWECRPENTIGAHCTGHNTKSIGVCYVGGMDADNKRPKDTRTTEQHKALLELMKYLMEKYNLTTDKIHCHNELCPPNKPKACPSFSIFDFRNELYSYLSDFDL